MYGESNVETYKTICKIVCLMGIHSMAQETQTGALYQPRWVGWGGRLYRDGTYVYLWLIPVEL